MSSDIPDPVLQAIGWAWAKACAMLDEMDCDRDAEDPRDYEIPRLLDDYRADCAASRQLKGRVRAVALDHVRRPANAPSQPSAGPETRASALAPGLRPPAEPRRYADQPPRPPLPWGLTAPGA